MVITEVKGSGKKPYILSQDGPVFSCTCPAWRNQSQPIDKRTCKHLKAHLGEDVELTRTATNTVEIEKIMTRADGRKLRPDEKAKLNGPPVLLAHPWTADVDPTGWWMSEKLDGVRAYWDGKNFISRQGNTYHAPEWFKQGLPEYPLDGELWMARQQFQATLSVVRSYDAGDAAWKKITYMIFDQPGPEAFEERNKKLLRWDDRIGGASPYVQILDQTQCKGIEHLRGTLAVAEKLGAEGLMLRKPGSLYEVGRSHTCLKVKTFHDAEAVVTAHKPGKGRHKGRLGALTVMMPDGKEFDIGTGFTDKERETPPEVGATVTYRYTELTKGGVPKCGSYVATRDYE